MNKLLVFVACVTAVGMATPVAHAAPDPQNSCWRWVDDVTGDTGTRTFVCPKGDGTRIFVSIRDENNEPVMAVPVSAEAHSSCDMCPCGSSVGAGFTDLNGEAYLKLCAGIDASGGTPCFSLTAIYNASNTEAGPFIVIEVDMFPKSIPSNKVSMSARVSLATPSLPISPRVNSYPLSKP